MDKYNIKGQSLIEIIIGISVAGILIGGATMAIALILRSNFDAKTTQAASFLASEYLDNINSISESNWKKIYYNYSNTAYSSSTVVSTDPFGIAFDSFTNSIWVANASSNIVNKINPSTNAVIATVTVGISPYGVAFDSFTNSIWVANNGSNTVNKINPSTNAVIATIAVGSNPRDVAFDSFTNSIWVANRSSNTVSKINPSTNAVIATIAVDTTPQSVAFDSFTNSIWVANNGSNTVSKINPSTNVVTATVNVGSYPGSIAFDSFTNSIWVANNGSNTVSKINPSTNVVTATVNVGSYPGSIAFDSFTNSIWVANYNSNIVSKINLSTNSIIGTYAVNTPTLIAFDPLTNSIWMTSLGSDNVIKLTPTLVPREPNSKFYLDLMGTSYSIIGGTTSTIIEGRNFTRYFYIENANRDSCGVGDISADAVSSCVNGPGTSGVAEDPSTQKITVKVEWEGGRFLSKSQYLIRSRNSSVSQSNWFGGGGQEGPIESFNNSFATSSNIDYSSLGSIKMQTVIAP